jgi:2-polyprenyl-6-methoxyphenol hydroxylase-like FAD-dependent oxidoreductase
MESQQANMGKAIVIGASISGLMAARGLANHFSQVTVIERDVFPAIGEPRKGVPQGNHAHVLLAHGRDIMESFFPGLTGELASLGAIVSDLSETMRWFSYGAYSRNFHSGMVSVEVSRPMLEGVIARRLKAISNVTMLENHNAVELLTSSTDTRTEVRVTGVKVEDRSGSAPMEIPLEANLVVDAAGRGSRCLTWLDNLGYPRPEEEQIKVNLCYTTRIFRRRPEDAEGHSPIVILPSKNNMRGGTMLAVEGERWIATLAGYLGDAAPTDMDGYLDFARSLDAPDCYDLMKTAEPLSEAKQYKYSASQRRHFEKLSSFPEAYLVCGDAICSFNPIYGQGMTTAATEATVLDKCLQAGLNGISRRFFHQASRLLDAPWAIAAGGDLAYPQVEGKRAITGRLLGLYLTRLLVKAHEDPNLSITFQRVSNLMEPPASLFRPETVLRVMFGNIKKTSAYQKEYTDGR